MKRLIPHESPETKKPRHHIHENHLQIASLIDIDLKHGSSDCLAWFAKIVIKLSVFRPETFHPLSLFLLLQVFNRNFLYSVVHYHFEMYPGR